MPDALAGRDVGATRNRCRDCRPDELGIMSGYGLTVPQLSGLVAGA